MSLSQFLSDGSIFDHGLSEIYSVSVTLLGSGLSVGSWRRIYSMCKCAFILPARVSLHQGDEGSPSSLSAQQTCILLILVSGYVGHMCVEMSFLVLQSRVSTFYSGILQQEVCYLQFKQAQVCVVLPRAPLTSHTLLLKLVAPAGMSWEDWRYLAFLSASPPRLSRLLSLLLLSLQLNTHA